MLDSLPSDLPSRFVVGIDLGTTNSAVNYVDTLDSPWRVRIFGIAQLVSPGEVELRDTLPSFHFEPATGEMAPNLLALPWNSSASHAVGTLARDYGQGSFGRVIGSAKSWLCHSGVDRLADILPWRGAEGAQQISPVEASARYLQHVHDAWNHQFPEFPLAAQDIVLTIPASFDEIARELTVQAAARAGLPRIVLLEEPQAAFYAWVDKHRAVWQEQVTLGQNILVIDLGGGTTDLTLIRVRGRGPSDRDQIQFHRVAVGDHLILGGDNLDLALAHHIEHSLTTSLTPRDWDHLVRQCRRAKEVLLGEDPPAQFTIHLAAAGSKVVGGSRQIPIERTEVERLLLDGFFPRCSLTDAPQALPSGFQEFSLPYAKDPAVTRYLAKFLRDHATEELGRAVGAVTAVRPDVVLFNGGVFSSPTIRQRMIAVLSEWFSWDGSPWLPQELPNARLDQAVAHGAAYYGMVRRGEGERIAAGLARSYYLQVGEREPQAVCLVPGTAEPGDSHLLDRPQFQLLVSQPAEFPLLVSSTRLTDTAGQVVKFDEEHMKPLPAIRTALQSGGKRQKSESVPVRLRADLTEIGTLELWCLAINDERRWRLQFDVRSAVATDVTSQRTSGESAGVWEETAWSPLEAILHGTFGSDGSEKPADVMRKLTTVIGVERDTWPMPLLRRIWETLIELQAGRRLSPQHEARWLNLLGFSLRPGYGMAVDDWRVAETWRTLHGKLIHGAIHSRNEMWILWRRLAGGLSARHQKTLSEPFIAAFRASRKTWLEGGGGRGEFSFQPQEAVELYRMLASLERLDKETKRELGDLFLDMVLRNKWKTAHAAWIWGIGRLGNRQPLYGPLNTVVDAPVVEHWIDRLLRSDSPEPRQWALAIMQLARRTGDRQRDIGAPIRSRVLQWLADHEGATELQTLVEHVGQLHGTLEIDLWGDSLPPGLQMVDPL